VATKKSGGQPGNKNGTKGKLCADAIRKAVIQGKNLQPLAKKLVQLALEGDMVAMKEVFDRLDGKVTTTIASDKDQPFTIEIRR